MSAYLFVHFKEKRTPEGEQVYFAVSRDGFVWEAVNDGAPVLWSYEGDKGVRDFAVARRRDGGFVIMATDLSLAYEFRYKYESDWENISRFGSKDLVMWRSDDLTAWTDQEMVHLGNEDFGCLWAPDIIYDVQQQDYIVHWSSAHRSNDFGSKIIFYSRTKDFVNFSKPEVLFQKPEGEGGIIDSAMAFENGIYYLFVRNELGESNVSLYKSAHATGPFEKIEAFDQCMKNMDSKFYEAPAVFSMGDGRWCLMLDKYNCPEDEQGYVPYLTDDLGSGQFQKADAKFSFPYGFKHGTVLSITDEEYARLKAYRKGSGEH